MVAAGVVYNSLIFLNMVAEGVVCNSLVFLNIVAEGVVCKGGQFKKYSYVS